MKEAEGNIGEENMSAPPEWDNDTQSRIYQPLTGGEPQELTAILIDKDLPQAFGAFGSPLERQPLVLPERDLSQEEREDLQVIRALGRRGVLRRIWHILGF